MSPLVRLASFVNPIGYSEGTKRRDCFCRRYHSIDKVNKFQVSEIEHPGALSKFGWKRGSEKNRVEVWGMESRPEG
eukprot:766783-Hanusia_phi.AAC.7